MRRKISLMLFFICLFISLNAQDHICFRNIPINGHLSVFVQKMKTLGYKSIYSSEKAEVFEGIFAGKEANIYVLASSKSKTVFKVTVLYPKRETWLKLKSEFLDMKDLFQKKYGTPNDVYDFFDSPYEEGDGYEIQALKSDKVHFVVFWDDKDGVIELSIDESCQVQITYEDNKNTIIANRELDDSRLRDI